jgi:alkanesulfonate monooxygenase SsuD/methylene tetrahydromethanopterin reductase-like flavin-dependent oxidoreductase (luciferase family)
MELSTMTEPQLGGTYAQILAFARWSEANGLASFARSDHYYTTRQPTPEATDAFATLAGLARDTDTIRLGVMVSPVTFRHPAVIAKTAATVDQMSGGRLDLGVGTGWMEAEHAAFGIPFPTWKERFARLEEALDYLAAAFGDDPATHNGNHYTLDANVGPKPSGIRLMVGGSGATRTPTLAGRHADEYNLFLDTPEEIAPKIKVMRQAAADRDVLVSVMGGGIIGRTDAEYRERLARFAASRGKTSEEIETRFTAEGVPMGSPSRVAETLAALEEIGVERWYVQWLDLADLDGYASTIEAIRAG